MDRLEDGLGVKLLDRGPNGIAATAFGELLCSHARLIKEELEFAKTRIQNAGKRRARVMTVGTLPSLAASVVPLAVSGWRERHPRVLLRVVEKVQAAARRFRFRHRSNGVLQYSGWTETACHLPRSFTGVCPS